ncbi:hypothetical protein EYF80_033004 [Liparis tanakae]|uniref:Uncharacterized protein n=1 Tax=Liparis tanakae TaxID=230148 RepID=A0A4Z2GTB0_9TELE|nr:hypothetical protein EYF80_033004 [Liparis tanakae]
MYEGPKSSACAETDNQSSFPEACGPAVPATATATGTSTAPPPSPPTSPPPPSPPPSLPPPSRNSFSRRSRSTASCSVLLLGNLSLLFSFFHFIRRFWNQIFTCRSVSASACDTSMRRFRVR